MVKYKNKEYPTPTAVAKAVGINPLSLAGRLRKGENLEDAVNALLSRRYSYKGKLFSSLQSLAEFANFPYATLYLRVKKGGMTPDEAIAMPVKKLKLGPVIAFKKTYKNLSVAAKAFGKDPEMTRNRVNEYGMTLEDALTLPDQRLKSIYAFGELFPSFAAFSRRYSFVNKATLLGRLRRGWAPENAVTTPIIRSGEQEVDGVKYKNIPELARAFKKPYKLVYKRIQVFKWGAKEAVLLPPKYGRTIRIGKKVYSSIKAAADAHGVNPGVAVYRLIAGWSVKKAFDPNAESHNRKSINVDGEFFPTHSHAARAFGIKEFTFLGRVNSGWTPEQAAGLVPSPAIRKGHAPIPAEEYLIRLHEVHGDGLDFSHANFKRATDKVEVICNQTANKGHPHFWASPNNLLQGKGCSICNLSHGAKRVARWLEQRNIHYEVEWTEHGLRSDTYERAALRFDFYIEANKTLIEYDGIQHFEPVRWFAQSDVEAMANFEIVKKNDKRKNAWAKKNGYKLIRIPYTKVVSEVLETKWQ
jgi:hypothetical protein